MANPRRTPFSVSGNNHQLPISSTQAPAALVNSFSSFLKKPHAFPFLLSFFLLLTWVSLRFQRSSDHLPPRELGPGSKGHRHGSSSEDRFANILRFSASSPLIAKDKRGWLLDPISVALDSAIPGGATSCASIHVGEIKPGGLRGNHRHHTCNETFVIWGAQTLFRLENTAVEVGYAQVIVGWDEVAVAVSRSGTAHALVNVDPSRTTFFIGCQDSIVNYTDSRTDFNIWNNL
ncbi:unnamed protein product [Cuscuta epithymum]|uniref:Cupin type-1 domain-containing protein n=1 Tax=Cuscuta epithymum TaxID=186058 RepID=A0AAV0CB86_9ASTE|nr:unnamed protein product [Cuscuta epithymum]